MNEAALLEARAAFVKLIREENADIADFAKQSLKQHWNGAVSGFSDERVQNRWQDFRAGWQAAKDNQ